MRELRFVAVCVLFVLVAAPSFGASRDDLAAARAVFEDNLDAIRNRDREAYLSTYLQSETLARTGPTGVTLGYEGLEASAGSGWPDVFEGLDLQLVPLRPGLVYGTYRYRVTFGEDEQSGISERFFVETDDGWKIAVTTAFESPPGTPPAPRALVGGTLVDGTGVAPIDDAVVVMRNGEIDCAGSRETCEVPSGIDVVDVSGTWITPGIVDAHVHFAQTGWADGRPDSIDVRETWPYEETAMELEENPERFLRSFLCSGVTAVYDVGGYPWTIELPERVATIPRAPHVSAAGPLISTLDFWLNLPAERQFIFAESEETVREGVRYLAARGADAIKFWYIAGEGMDAGSSREAVMAAGDEAATHGLPLIVHATELDTAKTALRAGAKLLVHSVTDREVDEEFLELLETSGAIYTPTLTVFRGYLRMFEAASAGRVPEIDDPHGCVSPWVMERIGATATAGTVATAEQLARREAGTSKLERIGAINLKRVIEAGLPVAMGTDAGNPLTLHGPSIHAEMEAMQAAGMTPMQVLVASTRIGARAMGLDERIGTIETSKVADLLVLHGDPTADIANVRKLELVIRGGVVRTVEELAFR